MTTPPLVIPDLSPFPTIVLIGLGNIGSQTIDALGRIKSLKRVVLIDPDIYSESNLGSQRIRRRDVNKPKVTVQAGRLAEINRDLDVLPVQAPIAIVPRGLLRGAIVMTALDSADARRDACEAAWRMGSTLIDGGVEPDLGLGRVTIYQPHASAACYECALDPEDYANMSAKHLCHDADAGDALATNGSPSLGTLVASLLNIEAEKLLNRELDGSLVGKQLVVDVTHHKQFITRLDRNERCRFDHARREIRDLAGVTERTSVAAALELAHAALGGDGVVSLGVDGHAFARALHCPGCSASRHLFALPERLPARRRTCAACGGREMRAVGFKQVNRLHAGDLPAAVLRQPLRALGVRSGDVLVADAGGREGFFEVAHE